MIWQLFSRLFKSNVDIDKQAEEKSFQALQTKYPQSKLMQRGFAVRPSRKTWERLSSSTGRLEAAMPWKFTPHHYAAFAEKFAVVSARHNLLGVHVGAYIWKIIDNEGTYDFYTSNDVRYKNELYIRISLMPLDRKNVEAAISSKSIVTTQERYKDLPLYLLIDEIGK